MWLKETANIQEMDRLVKQYHDLTLTAERCRRDNSGQMTVQEAEHYDQAAKICDQIMRLSLSERAVYTKWSGRKQECLRMIEEIADALAPRPTAPEAPQEPTRQKLREEVPAEVIASWYQKKPHVTWDDLAGMAEQKARFRSHIDWMLDLTELGCLRSYLFYGLPGTGKTYAARAFARELMDAGFRFLYINYVDICSSFVGEAEKRILAAFREAVDNAPCVLYFDNIEMFCRNRDHASVAVHEARLTIAMLEGYNLLRSSGKPVLLFGETNCPELIDEALLRRINLLKFPLPGKSDRAAYFARALASLIPEDGFSIDDMVERTDNYSYRDMNRLSESIRLKMKFAIIADCQVFDGDGKLDQEASDLAATEALKAPMVLTRAMFEEALQETPVSDKTAFLSRLADFEKRFAY